MKSPLNLCQHVGLVKHSKPSSVRIRLGYVTFVVLQFAIHLFSPFARKRKLFTSFVCNLAEY